MRYAAASRRTPSIIPKGLRNLAQGCGNSRYPGNDGTFHFNPNGVASLYVQAEKCFEW
jgi:hypothetical protein